jgi:hypothetical protein
VRRPTAASMTTRKGTWRRVWVSICGQSVLGRSPSRSRHGAGLLADAALPLWIDPRRPPTGSDGGWWPWSSASGPSGCWVSLHERTLDIRKPVLGQDHPDTAKSLGKLAGLAGCRFLWPWLAEATR